MWKRPRKASVVVGAAALVALAALWRLGVVTAMAVQLYRLAMRVAAVVATVPAAIAAALVLI